MHGLGTPSKEDTDKLKGLVCYPYRCSTLIKKKKKDFDQVRSTSEVKTFLASENSFLVQSL